MKKIALFFDCCDIATFYTKISLIGALNDLNVQADLFITPFPGEYCFTHDYYKTSDFFDPSVKFDIPSIKDYQCLVIGARHNKTNIAIRNNLIDYFLKNKRRVIALQDSANFDYSNSKADLYCAPSINQFKVLKTANDINKSSKKIEIPLLSNLSWKKHEQFKPLTREAFMEEYGLPADKKIVAFFPDGEHGHPGMPASHWMHKNINQISSILNEKGYVLVAKLHPYEHYGRKRNYYGNYSNVYYGWNCKTIREEHAHELVSYSDFALSSVSCTMYEHYLYNLPHLNIGMHPEDSKVITENGKISGYDIFKKNGYVNPIPENFDLLGLIYGKTYPFKDAEKDIHSIVDNFINSKKIIKECYQYYRNNPLYGESYSSSVYDVASALVAECL